ncbi:MAG: bifunctional methylenetetrahydrofolate dehydrogenase/methenyltetrahydrofolate cyclohydrolase FolD [Kiritimatiellae bacterium]|nr:bifunctional methylenetetrahydrofolate dehydrogenase/methenyltetrahydrofolate cyclohydrolase FolD [Kiritimatiellia bacterium]
MSAQILDGKAFAEKWHREAADAAADLKARTGVVPGLAVILVGDNPASVSYVTAKERACERDGFLSRHIHLPEDVAEADLVRTVRELNGDPAVHGILVQLPLPRHIREEAVIDAIAPAKDVDGFTPENIGRMVIGRECFLPCTPHGIVQLLVEAGIETSGRHAVVVGRSNIVGRPLANLLMRKGPGGNATVTICHTATRDLASYTRQADILVVAVGRAQTVTGDMVKPGATVIDVGVNRVPDPAAKRGYRLVGDVDFASAAERAAFITPVPGGVGPLTIAMLMRNTLLAAQRAAGG